MEIINKGYIHLIIGPMFSGKSTYLINIIRRFKSIDEKILVIKHAYDQRYNSGKNQLSSHDEIKEDCISCNRLDEITTNIDRYKPNYDKASIVVIEEAHFFDDLLDFTKKASDIDNKYVIICGLNGDYLRRPFGNILNIMSLANKIEKLHAYCGICRDMTPADYTLRLNNKPELILVGDRESYVPVCRKHYIEKTNS